jgi:hypothetical protein
MIKFVSVIFLGKLSRRQRVADSATCLDIARKQRPPCHLTRRQGLPSREKTDLPLNSGEKTFNAAKSAM